MFNRPIIVIQVIQPQPAPEPKPLTFFEEAELRHRKFQEDFDKKREDFHKFMNR